MVMDKLLNFSNSHLQNGDMIPTVLGLLGGQNEITCVKQLENYVDRVKAQQVMAVMIILCYYYRLTQQRSEWKESSGLILGETEA